MPVVKLRAPLSELAGGNKELELDGSTVAEVLQALEREHPDVKGWILDERGLIREHINVFVNKDYGREDTAVNASDRLHVLPAISGG
ncbi:MAG: MoaD/ThiS family protein [Thermoleophilia bacterium]|nr:MoaD/ThiS family protein [Thermoleophilia bacterium]MDH4339414.1 MoaD/ThiS family protein [Thermoleophilia bacterium]MDH5279802.1 MoaD/ThiS family protein [Thermoleophilia bacterium]